MKIKHFLIIELLLLALIFSACGMKEMESKDDKKTDIQVETLEEALEKNAQIISGDYHTDGVQSGFFSMIEEECYNGGSLWYTYICENELEEAKKYIDVEHSDWR